MWKWYLYGDHSTKPDMNTIEDMDVTNEQNLAPVVGAKRRVVEESSDKIIVMRRAGSDPALNDPRLMLQTEVIGDDLKRLSEQVKIDHDLVQAQVNFLNSSQTECQEKVGKLVQDTNSTVMQAESMLKSIAAALQKLNDRQDTMQKNRNTSARSNFEGSNRT